MAVVHVLCKKACMSYAAKPLNIGIVGGGASGVIAALALCEQNTYIAITIFESGMHLGRGLAYQSEELTRLLNVPVEKMSAYENQPNHFAEWVLNQHPILLESAHFPYVPRSIFGNYLQDLIRQMPQVQWVRERASDIQFRSEQWHILTDGDRTFTFDKCIIATGYQREISIPWSHPNSKFIRSAHAADSIDDVAPNDPVIIVGAGLTAIDMWRDLRTSGHRGVIHMISRRGRLPLSHLDTHPQGEFRIGQAKSPRQVMRLARVWQEQRQLPWPHIANLLRPQAQSIWQSWTPRERQQFIRHIKPYWEIIRHRVPATIAQELNIELMLGRLVLQRGYIDSISQDKKNLKLHAHQYSKCFSLEGSHIFLATGAPIDPRFSELESLESSSLHFIGPVQKPRLWESTAIPEIRQQAQLLAIQLHENKQI